MELSTIHAYQKKYANVSPGVLQNPSECDLKERKGREWLNDKTIAE